MACLPYPLPVVHYLKCVFPGRKPLEYIGDWPRRRRIYECELRPCTHTGEDRIYVAGFQANYPYGSFKLHRFKWVASVWLN